MQCKERGDANSELFKEPHDEAVHKNSYKGRLCELISASLDNLRRQPRPFFKTCGEAATTTLSAKGAVKPKNPTADRRIKLENLLLRPPHKKPFAKLYTLCYNNFAGMARLF